MLQNCAKENIPKGTYIFNQEINSSVLADSNRKAAKLRRLFFFLGGGLEKQTNLPSGTSELLAITGGYFNRLGKKKYIYVINTPFNKLYSIISTRRLNR